MLNIRSPETSSLDRRRTFRKVAKVAQLTRARDRAGVVVWDSRNRISELRIGESMRL